MPEPAAPRKGTAVNTTTPTPERARKALSQSPPYGHPLWYHAAFWQRDTRGRIRCAVCYRAWPPELEDNLATDRIVPAKEGGRYEWGNIHLLCPTCNATKRHRPLQWARAQIAQRAHETPFAYSRRKRAEQRAAVRADPARYAEQKARSNARARQRYANDPVVREKAKANARKHHARELTES